MNELVKLDEIHQREQYFWTQQTLHKLATFLEPYQNPCLLCCPTLGQELERRRKQCTTLDIDKRFNFLKGYQYYDVWKPKPIEGEFDIIVVDPPFYSVTVSHLFKAIRQLSEGKNKPLILTHLVRKKDAVVSTFAQFDVKPISLSPEYKTVKKSEIQYFTNIQPFLI